uniref:TPR repeat protein n=1 Tax=mine drainage metagenome TaxID=410659 RepID=E6PYN3_9ZZZZ
MNRIARLPVLTATLVVMMASLSGCNRLAARDQLNKGVEAYKAGKFEAAITHFQEAIKDDPKLPMAKNYLATALSQNVVPGLDTPDNLKTANHAIDIYKLVLVDDPNDINSLKGVASLYFNIKKLDEAKDWQKKVLAVDPKDPEAAYTVGVVDWTLAHENALKILAPAGMNDDGIGNAKLPKKECLVLQQENAPLVEEGIKYLTMAIDNRPNYDAAMAYMNLIYRRKADLDCGDDAARKADAALADDWRQKAMGARKDNEAKKSQGPGGIVMDSNGNMK